MISYTVKDIITNLYEQLVDDQYSFKNFQKNEGIYFQVKVSSECHGYEKDGNTHHPEWKGRCNAEFHVIILNGRKVFTNTIINSFSKEIPQTGWVNTSNHNSCWSSGCDALTSLGFEVVQEAFKNLPEDEQGLMYPLDSHVNFSLRTGLFGSVFKFVEVEMNDAEDNYHYDIFSVKQIKKQIEV